MTLGELCGCALLGFGAPLALWCTSSREPVRVIVTVGAAFTWLLAFLLGSLLWFALVPLRSYLVYGLIVAVGLQEVFRYGMYRLLRMTEVLLKVVSEHRDAATDRHGMAGVAGLGFGLMSGAFALINVLADTAGPGTLGLKSGSEYFVVTSACMTLCMILLNTVWTVVMFSGLDDGNYLKVTWVVGSHYLVSCITLLNRYHLYSATLSVAYAVLLVTAVLAFRCAGGSARALLRTFSTPGT